MPSEPVPGGSGGGDPATPAVESSWLDDALEVLDLRRRILVVSALGISVLGIVMAVLAPSLVPPRPLVGGAVGLAAVLLAVAIALAVDSADLTVRGSRHVRAAGADVLATGATAIGVFENLARVMLERSGDRILAAVVPASSKVRRVGERADLLGTELSRAGRRVLVVDLSSGPSDVPGLADVARQERKLSRTVSFDDQYLLARIGPGRDVETALSALPGLIDRLPSDIDAMVVALPAVSHPEMLTAASAFSDATLLVERDRTSRVELLATLEALESVGTHADVVLLGGRSGRPSVGALTATQTATEEPEPPEDPEGGTEPTPGAAPLEDPEPMAAEEPVSSTPSAEAASAPEPASVPEPARVPEPASVADEPTEVDVRDEVPATDAPARADLDPARERPLEPGRWAHPPGHADLVGAASSEATASNEGAASSVGAASSEEDSEDPLRVAAALQTLAQEVWGRGRDDET